MASIPSARALLPCASRKSLSCSSSFSKLPISSELITGVVDDASGGLAAFLCVDEEVLNRARRSENEGEQAIVEEIEKYVRENPNDTELGELLRYVLHEKASTKRRDPDDMIRDEGHNDMTLNDFVQHASAVEAKLTRAHVLALRLYTTAAYRFINDPLRKRESGTPHPLPATVTLISDGIKKLRVVTAKNSDLRIDGAELTFYRGIKNVRMSYSFATNGGTERAPMSTTSDCRIAAQYAVHSGASLLFKIKVSHALKLGANLQFLSAYPQEVEYLYPPLTFLQPTKRVQTLSEGTASLTVVEVEPDLSADS